MFPYGFVHRCKETDCGMIAGPAIYKMRQCSHKQDKQDSDYGETF